MASSIEIRTTQKTALFDLLTIKAEMMKEKKETDKWLEKLIIKMEAGMEEEDVAYVEKKIAQLP